VATREPRWAVKRAIYVCKAPSPLAALSRLQKLTETFRMQASLSDNVRMEVARGVSTRLPNDVTEPTGEKLPHLSRTRETSACTCSRRVSMAAKQLGAGPSSSIFIVERVDFLDEGYRRLRTRNEEGRRAGPGCNWR
jgi:hypothetical protein